MKNSALKFAAVISVVLMSMVMAAPAVAQEGTFTVKQSVSVSSIVLPPGTYVFRQIGLDGVIEISEVNGRNLGMFLTEPSTRTSNLESTVLTLKDQRVESVHFADSDVNLQFLYSAKNSARNKTANVSNGL
jgi:hypothetical protein